MRKATMVALFAMLSVACGGAEPPAPDGGPPPPDGGSPPADSGASDAGPPDTGPQPFALTSGAYAEGEMIPLRHECGPPLIPEGAGENISPALAWTPGPAGTMSYAIVMRDDDAGGFVHWVLYDVPASVLEVPEAVPPGYEPAFPAGAKQAELQRSRYFGYLGPCSPGSINTYRITVHALDTATLPGVDATTTENALAAAVEAASIASASLSGES